jgi:hypothetical protein
MFFALGQDGGMHCYLLYSDNLGFCIANFSILLAFHYLYTSFPSGILSVRGMTLAFSFRNIPTRSWNNYRSYDKRTGYMNALTAQLGSGVYDDNSSSVERVRVTIPLQQFWYLHFP